MGNERDHMFVWFLYIVECLLISITHDDDAA